MSKKVNEKWKKTFPDAIGNQNRPATGVDDTQPFETGGFPQYMANDPVRYDLQNAAMSQSMSNDARLKEMVDARGKELDDHKVDPGAHKTGIAGNAATATKVVTTAATGASANIAEASMGGSDSARIRVSSAENAGELALETADNGDEAIVARQYTGAYEKVARTASILDKNGNTAFPGTVVAPNFTGSLNGNAATATKLQTARTLSLTGKAAGSATFDGSANAAINVTSVNADTASKLSTARKINITGNASGSATFDGSNNISISTTVDKSKHAAVADTLKSSAATETSTVAQPVWLSWEGDNTKQTVSPNLTYTCSTKTLTAANFKGHLAGNADSASLISPFEIATANAFRNVWFSDSSTNNKACYNPNIQYNPSTNVLKVGTVQGTATNADTVDGYHASDLLSKIYPVGSIYMSMSATNPHDLFGVGTWQRISQGRMLLGADDSTYKAGATGGEATHTLTAAEMPAHSHTGTTSTNGNHTHQVSRNIDLSSADPNGEGGSHDTICDYDGGTNFKTSAAGDHNHTFTTGNSGGGAAHNNMSPYLVCCIWQRTA